MVGMKRVVVWRQGQSEPNTGTVTHGPKEGLFCDCTIPIIDQPDLRTVRKIKPRDVYSTGRGVGTPSARPT